MKIVRNLVFLFPIFLFNIALGQRIGGTIYTNIPGYRVEGRVEHPGDDTRTKPIPNSNPNVQTEEVKTFSPYFDDTLIDSFWTEYNSISPRADNDTLNHFIHFEGLDKKYLALFKLIYGDKFRLPEQEMFVMTDTLLHKKTAQIIYKAVSSKSQGVLNVDFVINKDRSIRLEKINFVQFDHAQNQFIDNLCENDLSSIKTGDISPLLDTAWRYGQSNNTEERKTLNKDLQKIKLKDNELFSSRLFIEDNMLWIVAIYDTDQDSKHLLLGYKLIAKKFKPTLVEVIKKDG